MESDPILTILSSQSKRILRKTDLVILPILIWIYFLQILDKSLLGYASVFGLQKDTGLVGSQYSMVGSISSIAQLAWLPFSSWLVVTVPHRYLMPALALGWGIAQACMAACNSYSGLLACRFFLGLFEAGCLPLFSIITTHWYRRAEQPIRVAAWYGTNGLATIIGSALSYGLGQIHSDAIHSWQIIFLFGGLLTIVSTPYVWWKLDNDVLSARFLTEKERAQAVERLRANQTGIGSAVFRWSQVLEIFLEPKSYLWFAMALLLNVGASVTNIFGPLILNGLGFSKSITSLLNMPFGAVQFLVILFGSYATHKFRLKSVVLVALMLPVVAGLVMLYVLPRNNSEQSALLAAYYLLAFLFGCNPLIVSWIVGNTAGATKKSIIMSIYNAGSSAGNIIGPLLFNASDAPEYLPGLRSDLAITVAFVAVVLIQLVNLMFLNKIQSRKRVANGKSAVIHDRSMDKHFTSLNNPGDEDGQAKPGAEVNDDSLLDRTDRQNDEFVYIY
ncbi:hypothetical protein Plec18167_005154 [Paecilomyces lecythidis]|uniref:Major facilitator superfamily (MFS) profile domain-containing protein n=1 Tax=Paecilomyces lecythidis TaxID=3004212 RepID=A0ABR3XLY1_9EURO